MTRTPTRASRAKKIPPGLQQRLRFMESREVELHQRIKVVTNELLEVRAEIAFIKGRVSEAQKKRRGGK